MRSVPFGILCSAAAMFIAAPAFAASDYYIVIDGVEGEATTSVEVLSWSWGTSNPGTAAVSDIGSSGQDGVGTLRESPSRPSVQASQNTQSLRESPTRASTGGVAVAAGDLDGDGRADLANLAQLDEVSGFSITLAPGASSRQMCARGKHIAKAHIVGREGVFDFEDLMVSSCDGSGGGGGSGGMTMSVTGRTTELKGHVTLIK